MIRTLPRAPIAKWRARAVCNPKMSALGLVKPPRGAHRSMASQYIESFKWFELVQGGRRRLKTRLRSARFGPDFVESAGASKPADSAQKTAHRNSKPVSSWFQIETHLRTIRENCVNYLNIHHILRV
jgi:hypothetical protein